MAGPGKEEKITEKPESEKEKDFKDPNLSGQGTKDTRKGKSKSKPDAEKTRKTRFRSPSPLPVR